MPEDDLVESIRAAVHLLDDAWEKGSVEFDAACLCLLLYKCEFDSWDDIQSGAPMCAGAIAFQEEHGVSSNLQRVCERLDLMEKRQPVKEGSQR